VSSSDRLAERVLARVAAALLACVLLLLEVWNVRDVEEAVLVLVLLVYRAHESSCGWQNLIDEDEDGLLRRQLNALANNIDELADSEVGRDQVLLLVDGRDIRLLDLLADNLLLLAAWCCVRKAAGGRTGMRSLYFWRMRSASALRFSNGCSSLNLERMLAVLSLL
jgi:hypothetical protein